MRGRVVVCGLAGAAGLVSLGAVPAGAMEPDGARTGAAVTSDEGQVVRETSAGGVTSVLRVGPTEVLDPVSGRYVSPAQASRPDADEYFSARRKRCYRRKIENVERSLGIRQWTLTLKQRWCGRGRRIVSKRKRCTGDAGFNWRVKKTSSVTRLTRSRKGARTKCRGWFHLDYSPIYHEEERGSIVFDFTGRGATRVVRMGSR